MNQEATCSCRWGKVFTAVPAPWRAFIEKNVSMACLLLTMGLNASAQNFYNLDFELAKALPPTGYLGSVSFTQAFPGWTGECATALGQALYNLEWLDTAGISLLDFNSEFDPAARWVSHGRYCACLYSGFSNGPNSLDVDASLAQTGLIPFGASTILFNYSPSTSTSAWGDGQVNLTFNGTPIALTLVSGGGAGLSVFSGDVSPYAGQVGTLRFTAPRHYPHGRSIFLLDYIRFPGTAPPPLPPLIITPPQAQQVAPGSNATFTVTTAGQPPLSYQWFFNNTHLLFGATGSALCLSNVQPAQAGFYSVAITNTFGAVTSPPVALAVLDPFILSQPRTYLADGGGVAWFSVVATGTAPLSYQWLKNGTLLEDGARISGAHTSLLTLSNAQSGDVGGYSVIIRNSQGQATSSIANLELNWPVPCRVLHSFTPAEGWCPTGTLLSSGAVLYGTTRLSAEHGTVFKVNTNGSGFAVLHDFSLSDGGEPYGGLALYNGMLYGTASIGGVSPDPGLVFSMNTDGTGFTSIKQFSGSDGRWPAGDLLLSGETLYGATVIGGAAGDGVVFKLNVDGTGYTVLHNFTGYPNDGYGPDGGLALSGSTLYGATGRGGHYGPPTGWSDAGYGTVFKVNTDGSGYTILKHFTSDTRWPCGGLVVSGTTLYGVTVGGFSGNGNYDGGTLFKLNTDGSGFAVLHNFAGPPGEGALPFCGLVLSGSKLYGLTSMGGSYGCSPDGQAHGYGTVFQINTDGSDYLVLKQLTGDEGRQPAGRLLLLGNVLYGTTAYGGASDNGVVFALPLPVPELTTAPLSQTAELGSTVIFAVQAATVPSLSYQWFFNGIKISGLDATSSCLRLTNVQPSQVGAYTVLLSNAFGAVTSNPALLSVIPPVPRRMVPALSLFGDVGSILDLEDSILLNPSPNWAPFDSVTLADSSQWYFDVSEPLLPQRFYRARQFGSTASAPALDLHMVPALTLTGAIGSSVRIDCINQVGPIDAWTNLATLTLTNTSQFYFDTSSIGQPPRLWRLVPVP